jgi:hypothetical protein
MQVTLHHVLPAAFPGMITSAVLALAHVSGETAPLMLDWHGGLYRQLPDQLASPATTTLPVQIYLWATGPGPGLCQQGGGGCGGAAGAGAIAECLGADRPPTVETSVVARQQQLRQPLALPHHPCQQYQP